MRKERRANESANLLSELVGEQMTLLGRMGSCLPKSGPTAEWMDQTLGGAHGDLATWCVADALLRQGRFPSRYLDPLIRLLCREPDRRGRAVERLVAGHGSIPVLDSMTRAVRQDAGLASGARILTYYVRSTETEPRAEADAAARRLRDALLELGAWRA